MPRDYKNYFNEKFKLDYFKSLTPHCVPLTPHIIFLFFRLVHFLIATRSM